MENLTQPLNRILLLVKRAYFIASFSESLSSCCCYKMPMGDKIARTSPGIICKDRSGLMGETLQLRKQYDSEAIYFYGNKTAA